MGRRPAPWLLLMLLVSPLAYASSEARYTLGRRRQDAERDE